MSLLFTGFISCDSDDSTTEDKIFIVYSNMFNTATTENGHYVYSLTAGVKNRSSESVKGKVKFHIKEYGEYTTQSSIIEPSYDYITGFNTSVVLANKVDKSQLDKVELIIEK